MVWMQHTTICDGEISLDTSLCVNSCLVAEDRLLHSLPHACSCFQICNTDHWFYFLHFLSSLWFNNLKPFISSIQICTVSQEWHIKGMSLECVWLQPLCEQLCVFFMYWILCVLFCIVHHTYFLKLCNIFVALWYRMMTMALLAI